MHYSNIKYFDFCVKKVFNKILKSILFYKYQIYYLIKILKVQKLLIEINLKIKLVKI